MKTSAGSMLTTAALGALVVMMSACSSSTHLAYQDRDDTYFTQDDRLADMSGKISPNGVAIVPTGNTKANGSGTSNLWQGGRPVAEIPTTITEPDSGQEYYKPGYNNSTPGSYNAYKNSQIYGSGSNNFYGNNGGFGGPQVGYNLAFGNNPYYSGLYGGMGYGSGFGNCFSCGPFQNGFYDPYGSTSFYNGGRWGYGAGIGYGYNPGWMTSVGYNSLTGWGMSYGYAGGFASPYGYYDPFAYGYGYNPYGYNPFGFGNTNIWNNHNPRPNNGLVTVVTGSNTNSGTSGNTFKGPSNRPGDGIINPGNNQNVTYTNGNGVGSGLTTNPNGSNPGSRGAIVNPGAGSSGNNVNSGTALSRQATAAQVIDLNPGAINRPTLNVVQDGGLVVPVSPETSNASYYVRPSSSMVGNGNNVAFPAYTPSSATRDNGYFAAPASPNRNDNRNNNNFGNFNSSNDGGGSRGGYSGSQSSGGGSVGGATPNIGGGGGGR